MGLFYHGCRFVLGAVFLYAGVTKGWDPSAFAVAVDNYRILPQTFVPVVAVVLPWIEVVCGLLLLTGRWLPGAVLVVMALLSIFLVALGSALWRGLDIACGCFSTAPEAGAINTYYFLRDFFLLAMSAYVFARLFAGLDEK